MNIKSLLIGSAAALVAVSGARAADAVVAEPEAVEYVRVCDAYGAGYFYIPGTETCLKISGFVRYEITGGTSATGFGKNANGRLEFSAKNESELGTVSSWIRLNPNRGSNGSALTAGTPAVVGPPAVPAVLPAPQVADFGASNGTDSQYSLEIGGLDMGYRDGQWNRFSGYGGVTDNGLNYGYQARHYISYTFSGEAFSAIVSLDHDNSANYVPDVMVGVKGTFSAGAASFSVGYDESEKDAAFKLGFDTKLGEARLRIIGQYATGANSYWYATNGNVSGNNANAMGIIVGVSAPVGEKLALGVDVGYNKATGGASNLRVGLDVNYKIATGLSALLAVGYSKSQGAAATNSYMLRFQRSF